MLVTIHCSAVVQLTAPLGREGIAPDGDVVREFLAVDGFLVLPGDQTFGPARLRVSKHEGAPSDEVDHLHRQGGSPDPAYIRLSTDVAVDTDGARTISSLVWDEDNAELMYEIEALGRFSETVNALLVCGHLAMPGKFGVSKAWFFPEEHEWEDPGLPQGRLDTVVDTATELRWPNVGVLALRDTLLWANGLEGWGLGVGTGPAGRALAAFGHLIIDRHETTPMGMIWALVGLEAVYCEGTGGLKEQLLSKSETLLGPRLENRKVFSRMYDYRSRLLHGDVNIPLPFREPPQLEQDVLTYSGATIQSYHVAAAMLIATLQELVRRGWHDIDFHQVASPR